MTTPRTITLRSRTGTPKGDAILVQTWDFGLRSTQNRDGRYRSMAGVDADGQMYRTTSCGNWTPVRSGSERAILLDRIQRRTHK